MAKHTTANAAAAPWLSPLERRRTERFLATLFLGHLRADEALEVDGDATADWWTMRWTLRRADRSFVYAVDVRLRRAASTLSDQRAKDALLDLLGSAFDSYLRQERAPFTGPKWEPVEFAGLTLWWRGQELDQRAEDDANALLAAGASAWGRRAAAELAAAGGGPTAGADEPEARRADAPRDQGSDQGADDTSEP